MKRPKHTPGPWQCEPLTKTPFGHEIDITANFVRGAVRTENYIATVQSSRLPGVVEADARLIAAAPDLLALLKAADTWIYADTRKECPYDTLGELLDAIHAAIAKAEGRQP